jgi:hypothetical protein
MVEGKILLPDLVCCQGVFAVNNKLADKETRRRGRKSLRKARALMLTSFGRRSEAWGVAFKYRYVFDGERSKVADGATESGALLLFLMIISNEGEREIVREGEGWGDTES